MAVDPVGPGIAVHLRKVKMGCRLTPRTRNTTLGISDELGICQIPAAYERGRSQNNARRIASRVSNEFRLAYGVSIKFRQAIDGIAQTRLFSMLFTVPRPKLIRILKAKVTGQINDPLALFQKPGRPAHRLGMRQR